MLFTWICFKENASAKDVSQSRAKEKETNELGPFQNTRYYVFVLKTCFARNNLHTILWTKTWYAFLDPFGTRSLSKEPQFRKQNWKWCRWGERSTFGWAFHRQQICKSKLWLPGQLLSRWSIGLCLKSCFCCEFACWRKPCLELELMERSFDAHAFFWFDGLPFPKLEWLQKWVQKWAKIGSLEDLKTNVQAVQIRFLSEERFHLSKTGHWQIQAA